MVPVLLLLVIAAGALFAYAWHAFASPPAFDAAPVVIVRISNVVFAALAATAVWIAALRSRHALRQAQSATRPD
jgi:hypothetical protein